MTYSEKLKDPRWQKKRLEILERDGWKCVNCSNGRSTLHVHHMSYIRNHNPWEYENNNFVTLCEYCHSTVHHVTDLVKNKDSIITTANIIRISERLLVADFLGKQEDEETNTEQPFNICGPVSIKEVLKGKKREVYHG